MTKGTPRLVEQYLKRPERALAGLPAPAGQEFIREIESHIVDACAGDEDPASLERALTDLGTPEELALEHLAAEAGGRRKGRRRGAAPVRPGLVVTGIWAAAVLLGAAVLGAAFCTLVPPPRVTDLTVEVPGHDPATPVVLFELPAVISARVTGARQVTAELEGQPLSGTTGAGHGVPPPGGRAGRLRV